MPNEPKYFGENLPYLKPFAKKGKLIAIEGTDGAGRSTQIALLKNWLEVQGYSVVVNVVLKTTASRQHIVTWNANLFEGGQDLFGGSYQFTAREGERTYGLTLSDGVSMSDSNGAGRAIRRAPDGPVPFFKASASAVSGVLPPLSNCTSAILNLTLCYGWFLRLSRPV